MKQSVVLLRNVCLEALKEESRPQGGKEKVLGSGGLWELCFLGICPGALGPLLPAFFSPAVLLFSGWSTGQRQGGFCETQKQIKSCPSWVATATRCRP